MLKKQTTALTELNEIKPRLFSILSHDLRCHVLAIYNAVQVSNNSEEGRAFVLHNLSALEKDTVDARNLLEGIMGWSKTLLYAAQPVIESVDLGHLVKGVVKFYEAATTKKKQFLFGCK